VTFDEERGTKMLRMTRPDILRSTMESMHSKVRLSSTVRRNPYLPRVLDVVISEPWERWRSRAEAC
jgi:hypothetical protein